MTPEQTAARRAQLAAGLNPPERPAPDVADMPPQPPLPAWVWLHGDVSAPAMDRLEAALRTAGYVTVRGDRTRAWHAARAGVTVVEVHIDMAPDTDLEAPITVQSVRARYAASPHTLPGLDHEAEHTQVMELVPIEGGRRPRPVDLRGALDIAAVVEWVGELVDRRLVGSGQAGNHVGLDPRDVRARLARDEFPEPDGYEPRGSRRQPWWWSSTLDRWNATRQHGAGRPRAGV